MPGNKNSGRPGGNPNLANYSFKQKGDEPLDVHVSLRITRTMKEKLNKVDNWRELVRRAIAQALEEEAQAS